MTGMVYSWQLCLRQLFCGRVLFSMAIFLEGVGDQKPPGPLSPYLLGQAGLEFWWGARKGSLPHKVVPRASRQLAHPLLGTLFLDASPD